MLTVNQAVAEFLKHVLEQIKYKKIHPYISNELEDHIESLREDYEKEGLTEELAYEKAITQMGDAISIGKRLHEKHKPRCEWPVLILLTLLIGISLLTLTKVAQYCGGRGTQYFPNQLVYVCAGSVFLIGFYFCDYKQLERFSPLIYGIGFILIEATVLFGLHINGKPRYLRFFPFAFYTSSLVMPFLVIGYIGFVRRWAQPRIRNFLALGLLALIPSLMIVQVSSWAIGVAIGVVFIIILTLYILGKEYKGHKVKTLSSLYGMLVPIGAVLFIMVVYSREYRIERFKAFLHPEADPEGSGYLYYTLMHIRQNAKFTGGGSFFDYAAPEGWLAADAVFTLLVGSMGWIMGAILLIILALIIIRLFKTAAKVQEGYGRLLAFSIACIFAAQFVLNIAMNFGYIPIVSMSLPFVSYGGSRLISNMVLLGLFMSTYRRKDLVFMSPSFLSKSSWFNKLWDQKNLTKSLSWADISHVSQGERNVREQDIARGREQGTLQVAKNLIGILEDELIAEKTGLSLEQVKKLKMDNN